MTTEYDMQASGSRWPLVAAQPGIWVADQTLSCHNAYTVAHRVDIAGDLVLDDFIWALRKGLSEADLLHAVVGSEAGVPYQRIPEVVSPAQVLGPSCLDVSGASDPEAQVYAWIAHDLKQDLRIGHATRFYRHALFKVSAAPARWVWYQRYHHIVVDGFSVLEIARRVAQLYACRRQAEQPDPSPFTPFSDVVQEYQAFYQSEAYARDASYWQAHCAEMGPPVTLSRHDLTAHALTSHILRREVTLTSPVFNTPALRASSVGRAMALLALWIGRSSGLDHFTLGHIFMRRMGSAALTACGPVINVLPMNVRLAPDATLDDTALALEATLKTMRRHQRFDAEQILRNAGRSQDALPLTGTVLNVKLFDRALTFEGQPATTQELLTGPVRDLELTPRFDAPDTLTLSVQAHAERYTDDDLDRLIAGLHALLERVSRDMTAPIAQFGVLTDAQQAWVAACNDTAMALPDHTLCDRLRTQARATPLALALSDEQTRYTYRDMDEAVQRRARQLAAQGAGRGTIVAVALPRSAALSLTLMAILETGAAYLPLDMGYPDQRLKWMVEDAAPVMLVTHAAAAARFEGWAPLVCCDDEDVRDDVTKIACSAPTPDDPAYVLYTSGSTGRPKGVVISHRAIVNRLLWMQHQYPLSANDAVLQKTPCSFDVSVWEFFWPLMTGAQLVMAPPEAHRDPAQLKALIEHHRITTLHFVPSMLAAFLEAQPAAQPMVLPSLRQVFCSGEALSVDLARQWQAVVGCALHNLYGPTEAAVDVSYQPASGPALTALTGRGVPIGRPVWNTQLHVLDAHQQPVPPGIAGELYLGGIQLADGYLNRPELTGERFVTVFWQPNARLYRTGDIARWRDDGTVEYLGRNDDQLKLRGQRIELGEIESALCECPSVAQAVVVARALDQTSQAGDTRQLMGYVMAEPGRVCDTESCRQQLMQRLPPHLIPTHIVTVETWPLSANGKLDRKALPLPNTAHVRGGRAPAPGLEATIAAAFAALLHHEDVSAEDDFFALGGHSLLAMQLAARLQQQLDQVISVGQVMETPTVARLAQALSVDRNHQAGFDTVLPLRQHAGRATLFCLHPASGFAWQFSIVLRYLDAVWNVIGLQSPSDTGGLACSDTLADLCDAQYAQIRALQPHGPYYLLGYSLGGTLAHGVAARLAAAGEYVAFLGLLDTYPAEAREWGAGADHDVLDEIAREQARFMAQARQGMGTAGEVQQQQMFAAINANYEHAMRLLGTATTPYFNGEATLFVAEQTCPDAWDVEALWCLYVRALSRHAVACSHVDMMSPAIFEQLGPVLSRVLNHAHTHA